MQRWRARIARGALVTVSLCCGGLASPPADAQVFESELHSFRAEVVVSGLEHPWGMAFLPDGRMLVTERPGRLRIISNDVLDPTPIAGVPEVYARNQGGLLDVVLHPEFSDNGWVYLSYSVVADGKARTAVGRGRLQDHALTDYEVILLADNPGRGGRHFGSRLIFGRDGKLYVTVGERGDREEAQNSATHHGKVLRLNDDGSVPPDNPFVGNPDYRPEIYTLGHRNPQGMAVHPDTGELWVSEHGPRGGDEVNRLVPGANYGWPIITHGRAYSGLRIGEGSAKAGLEQPAWQWTPSIAPSGAMFYDGAMFEEWRGNLFVGALKHQYLARLVLDGGRVIGEEQLLDGQFGRLRDVRNGAGGEVYLLTDQASGQVIRLEEM